MWSPREHILKSLASKPQVLENCPVLSSRTALFMNRWNFVGKRQKPCGKSAKTFFWFPQVEIAWKKFFEDLFRLKKIFKDVFLRSSEKKLLKTFFFLRTLASVSLVLGLERVCSWPWPRNFLCLHYLDVLHGRLLGSLVNFQRLFHLFLKFFSLVHLFLKQLFHLFLTFDPATFSLVSKVPQVKKSFIPY